jgi:L-ascorbate metabolism protein UlaG (beta-lactamase superfamily)
MVFEDPDGTRILYDPGRTVAGPDDSRLGKIDAILVSHMHGDHVGDTGVTAEQDTVVRQLYNAKLVVMNIGDTYTTGPKEAAWVINKLIKPKSVIPSHANQPSTSGGKVIAGTRTDTFIKASKATVHLPLSGRTMTFNDKGKCVDGC